MNDSFVAPPRRRSKTPVTWPAFMLAAIAGIAAAAYYGLKVHPVRLYDEDLSNALWRAISPNLVPATVGALVIWSLLYFGFVRWKNGERGPLYFNLLFPIILGTLVAIPFGDQAYRTWKNGDVKGLNAALPKAGVAGRSRELQARAPLTAALTAAYEDIRLTPETLTTAADRSAAKARIAAAREASRAYHEGYAARATITRAAYQKATVDHGVSTEIARDTLANYDTAVARELKRNEKILGWEQALFNEADGGISALSRSPWRVEGDRWLFTSRQDGEAFIGHVRRAAVLRAQLKVMEDGMSDVRVVDRRSRPAGTKFVPVPDTYN